MERSGTELTACCTDMPTRERRFPRSPRLATYLSCGVTEGELRCRLRPTRNPDSAFPASSNNYSEAAACAGCAVGRCGDRRRRAAPTRNDARPPTQAICRRASFFPPSSGRPVHIAQHETSGYLPVLWCNPQFTVIIEASVRAPSKWNTQYSESAHALRQHRSRERDSLLDLA
jgi:hypothetical protein